jgi:glycosyltransferase involved in cell wall biosynthesis
MNDTAGINLYYISPRDILKARVDPIVIMKTCYALSLKKVKVRLIYPNVFRKNNLKEEHLDDIYQIKHDNFKMTRLPTVIWDGAPVFWLRINKFFFHSFIAFFLLLKFIFTSKKIKKVIFSRCLISTLPYIIILKPFKNILNVSFIYELHAMINDAKHRLILKNQDRILCISETLREILCKTLPYESEKTEIAKCSVEPRDYENKPKAQCRKNTGLPEDKFIVTYTGKVYAEMKEIEYILKAAKILKDVLFIIVGGKEEPVKMFKDKCESEGIKNVLFPGFIKIEKVQKYQIASDVLVLYYPGDWPIRDFLSPGKMIEYMASGNAIITVNFNSLTEVLKNEYNALVIEPDNPPLLAEAILRLKNDRKLFELISKNAKKDSYNYSWDSRADRIIEKIKSL